MTKAEWRTTCERVAAERRIFLLQDADTLTMDGKSRQRYNRSFACLRGSLTQKQLAGLIDCRLTVPKSC